MTYDPVLEKAKRFYDKKLDKLKQAWSAAFDTIKERALRAEAGQGLGQCKDCKFKIPGPKDCLWGYCDFMSAANNHVTFPRPWAHLEANNRQITYKMVVSDEFGCVLFSRKQPHIYNR